MGYKMELMQLTRAEEKKMAHYIGMDPTGKAYHERVMAGAKKYGEDAVARAKQGRSCSRITRFGLWALLILNI